jgi:hypothetical protein
MTADRAMQNWRNLPHGINTLAASSRDFDKFKCTKMRTSHSPKVIQGITTGNIHELQKNVICPANARIHARMQKDFESCSGQHLLGGHVNCFHKAAEGVRGLPTQQ